MHRMILRPAVMTVLSCVLVNCGGGDSSDDGQGKKRANAPEKSVEFSMDFVNTLSEEEALIAFAELFERLGDFHRQVPSMSCPETADSSEEEGKRLTDLMLQAMGLSGSQNTRSPLRDRLGDIKKVDEKQPGGVTTFTRLDDPQKFAIGFAVATDAKVSGPTEFSTKGEEIYTYGGNDDYLFVKGITLNSSMDLAGTEKLPETSIKDMNQVRLLEYDRKNQIVTQKFSNASVHNGTGVEIDETAVYSLADLTLSYEFLLTNPGAKNHFVGSYARVDDGVKMEWTSVATSKYTGSKNTSFLPEGTVTYRVVSPAKGLPCLDLSQ